MPQSIGGFLQVQAPADETLFQHRARLVGRDEGRNQGRLRPEVLRTRTCRGDAVPLSPRDDREPAVYAFTPSTGSRVNAKVLGVLGVLRVLKVLVLKVL